jgi:DMSO/TMAO reductase YedYZ heme-binding membrane subunit
MCESSASAQYNHIWWTTLHHLWFVPLCLAVLHTDFKHHGVPLKAWINATVINFIAALVLRVLGTPNEHGIYKNYCILIEH